MEMETKDHVNKYNNIYSVYGVACCGYLNGHVSQFLTNLS